MVSGMESLGGTEEYRVVEAVENGRITKPVIGWCIGTIANHFYSGVQFGHAGASASSDIEGVLRVDMWRGLGCSEEEIGRFIDSGTLNAFLVLGRSIGFIGHILDEKRLNMPMYRHPFDDILYDVITPPAD